MKEDPHHPNVYVIAGCNGVGKTTFASRFLHRIVDCQISVNAGAIAKELEDQVSAREIEAGKRMLQQI